jgi:signal transduction histidine kinase
VKATPDPELRQLVLAADADRRKIERELHDGVQQHLVALAVNLQLAERLVDDDPVAAEALLHEMGRDVKQALEETVQLAQRIYPPLLEAGGLAAALRAVASSTGVTSSVEVATTGTYPPEVVTTVYLCWFEALNSATAGAPVTIAVLETEGGGLSFEIRGCEPLPDRLRDRVEALGGELVSSDARVLGSLPV